MRRQINSFVERVQQAADAVLASSVGAARLALVAQQLADCRQANNPRSQWLPGMVPQQAMWAADPCLPLENELASLQTEAAGEKEVPAGNLGAAVAPQLATEGDPVPNMDPAIPAQEFTAGEPGASNRWAETWGPEDLLEMIIEEMGDRPLTSEEMEDLESILEMTQVVHLWCPWGGPGTKNLKWKMKYNPRNQGWLGKWAP